MNQHKNPRVTGRRHYYRILSCLPYLFCCTSHPTLVWPRQLTSPTDSLHQTPAAVTQTLPDDNQYTILPPYRMISTQSAEASPQQHAQHSGHMPPAFHHAQMHHPGHPGHPIPPPQHLPPPGPYHNSSMVKDETSGPLQELEPPHPLSQQSQSNGNPGPLTTAPPTKGKNGATGPADGKAKPHLCQICKRGFTTGGHLQRHQRIHTGVKAFRCPFPGCETRTSRQDNLQQQ